MLREVSTGLLGPFRSPDVPSRALCRVALLLKIDSITNSGGTLIGLGGRV